MSEEHIRWLNQFMRESARDAMKAGMIINGAAAIALLAFIGNIWPDAKHMEAVGALADVLIYFCVGVALSGFAFAMFFAVLQQDASPNSKRENFLQGIFNQYLYWTWALGFIVPFVTFFIGVFEFRDAVHDHFL